VLQDLFDDFMTSASVPGSGDADTPGDAVGSGGFSTDAGSLLRLHPVSPNPTSGPVEVVFELSEPRAVHLAVFDAQGRERETILACALAAGTHRVRWDPPGTGGVFFLRLESEGAVVTRKVGVAR